ncbi:hypothetical protein BFJ70_g2927 [Fusarium oxysporum]|nr:hypothetical protein BFJ71_g3557 [Fusarium oxysporum]RKL46438.1 hypothetical protein BFJ70_g2927 [Fusarium oxysporum]
MYIKSSRAQVNYSSSSTTTIPSSYPISPDYSSHRTRCDLSNFITIKPKPTTKMQPRLERLQPMLGNPLFESILWGHEYDLSRLNTDLR